MPPIEEINRRITPTVPQGDITLLHKNTERRIELIPQVIKNVVRMPLCLPSAYSLIMRQLGLNSGLTKCKINKQSKENDASVIVRRDSVFIVIFFLDK